MIVDQTFLAIVFGSAMYQLVSRVLSNCILVKCVVRCVLDCFVQEFPNQTFFVIIIKGFTNIVFNFMFKIFKEKV